MARVKKAGLDQKLLMILGISFGTIVVLLPVHAFISTWGGTAIGPLLVWKSWKEILIALLIPVVIWLCVLRPDIRRAVWKSWLNRIIAVYVVVTIIMAFVSAASKDAVIAGLLMNLRFLAMFVLAQVIVAGNPAWLARFKKVVEPWLVWTGVLLAIFALLQVTVIPKDFLSHFGYDKNTTIAPYVLVDQDPHAMRAFAIMRGPNTLASYLLLPMAAALVMWWQDRRNWWVLGAAGIMTVALGLTGSRSGWLGAAAMGVTLTYIILPRQKLVRIIKFGTIPIAIIVVVGLWLATTVPAIRLAVFHSGGNTQAESLTEGSSDKHWQATVSGIENMTDDPLGAGVGTAGPASFYNAAAPPSIPEDYYVQIGEEVGLLGLGLFLVMSVLIAKKLWQHQVMSRALLASFIGIAVINLFLHGWADDPTAMTWWGIAGLFVGLPKQK